jgi:hypothetical protein
MFSRVVHYLLRLPRWWIWRVRRRIQSFAPSSPIKPKLPGLENIFALFSQAIPITCYSHSTVGIVACLFFCRPSFKEGMASSRSPGSLFRHTMSMARILLWRTIIIVSVLAMIATFSHVLEGALCIATQFFRTVT